MNPPASLAGFLLAQEGLKWRAARRAAWSLLGLFFQRECRGCGRRVESPLLGRLCEQCWDRIPVLSGPCCPRCCLPLPALTWKGREEASCRDCRRLKPRFRRAKALFPFKGLAREMIHDYKFSSATSLRRPLARCLARTYASTDWGLTHSCLVHVPTSPEALKERGFDHAADLAKSLSLRLGIPHFPALARKPGFRRQSNLSRAQRLLNTREAYIIKEGHSLGGLNVLLVDDVLTTGATASTCARALLTAGATKVDVLALARSV